MIFVYINAWLQRRKERKAVARERKGYELATAELWEGGDAKEAELDSFVQEAKDMGHYDDFDRGVERALREWREQ